MLEPDQHVLQLPVLGEVVPGDLERLLRSLSLGYRDLHRSLPFKAKSHLIIKGFYGHIPNLFMINSTEC